MSSPSCDSTDGSLRIYEQYAEFHCGDPPTVAVNTLPKALLPKSMQISLHPEGWKLLLVMHEEFRPDCAGHHHIQVELVGKEMSAGGAVPLPNLAHCLPSLCAPLPGKLRCSSHSA